MLTRASLLFDVFKESKDYFDWNKYVEYIRREPAFNNEKKEELEKLYLFLKKELGKEFLKKPFKDGRDLVNSWLWSHGLRYKELKWLGECLAFFRDKECNYVKVIGKLRSVDKCNTEGIPFLTIGDALRKVGFEVQFEPQTEFNSNPDLKITNPVTGDIIFAEVSYQDESKRTEYIKDTYHFLFDCFHRKPPYVCFSGKIHGYAERDALKIVGEHILSVKQTANNAESVIFVSKEETGGIIEFAVAHESKTKELEELEITKKHKLFNIEGQGLDLDYTPRLLSKTKEKIKQHPKDLPLILYVTLDQLFFLLGLQDPSALITNVKRTLSEFPNAIGVCMIVQLGAETKPVKELFGNNFFQRKMIFDNYAQANTLFIYNEWFDNTRLSDSLKKLFGSFEMLYE